MTKYTTEQWAEAERLWRANAAPVVIERTTGIPRPSLYDRCKKGRWPRRGPLRVRPDRLQRIRQDWQRGMSIDAMARKHRLHRTRFGQLAQQHGWPRWKPRSVPTPLWRRCCGAKLPYTAVCPTCASGGVVPKNTLPRRQCE